MNDSLELRDRVIGEWSGEINPHRQNISLLVFDLLADADMQISAYLGIQGSVLNEIYQRLSPEGGQNPIDTKGMDPKLARFVRGPQFFIEVPQQKNSTEVHQNFQIDCIAGTFTPSMRMKTHDGRIEIKVLTGPDHIDFSNVSITRVYEDDAGSPYYKRGIRTFPTPSRPENRANELKIIEHSRWGQEIGIEYEAVGVTGDLRIVNGQTVLMMPGPIGKYNSDLSTIDWRGATTGYPAPQLIVDPHMLILEQSGGTRFSFLKQTNLYEEFRFILQTNSDIRISK